MIKPTRPPMRLGVHVPVERFVHRVNGNLTRVMQGAAVTLFNEMQVGGRFSPGTPIDTGNARASWDVEIGGPAAGLSSGTPEAAAGRALARVSGWTPGAGVVEIANNAPYIRRLEFGHSQQAPQGMVRLAVAGWDQIVDEVAQFVGAADA